MKKYYLFSCFLIIFSNIVYSQEIPEPKTMAIVSFEFQNDTMNATIAQDIVNEIERVFFDHPTDSANDYFVNWTGGMVSYTKDGNNDGRIDYLGHIVLEESITDDVNLKFLFSNLSHDAYGKDIIDSYDQIIFVLSAVAPGAGGHSLVNYPRTEIHNTSAKAFIKFHTQPDNNTGQKWETRIRRTIVHEMLHGLGLHHVYAPDGEERFNDGNNPGFFPHRVGGRLDSLGARTIDFSYLNLPHLYQLEKYQQADVNYIEHVYESQNNASYSIPELTNYTDGDVRGIVIPEGKADNYYDATVWIFPSYAPYYNQTYDYFVSYSNKEGSDYVYIHKGAAGQAFLLEKLTSGQVYHDTRNNITISFTGVIHHRADVKIEVGEKNVDCRMVSNPLYTEFSIEAYSSTGFGGLGLEYTITNEDTLPSSCVETFEYNVIAKLFKGSTLISEKRLTHTLTQQEVFVTNEFFALPAASDEITPANFGDTYRFEVQAYREASVANGAVQEYLWTRKNQEINFTPNYVIDGNYDGVVNINDFLGFSALWQKTPKNYVYDSDFDRLIGINDYLSILGAWEKTFIDRRQN